MKFATLKLNKNDVNIKLNIKIEEISIARSEIGNTEILNNYLIVAKFKYKKLKQPLELEDDVQFWVELSEYSLYLTKPYLR